MRTSTRPGSMLPSVAPISCITFCFAKLSRTLSANPGSIGLNSCTFNIIDVLAPIALGETVLYNTLAQPQKEADKAIVIWSQAPHSVDIISVRRLEPEEWVGCTLRTTRCLTGRLR